MYWHVLIGEREGERERERNDHVKDMNLIQIWFAIISAQHKAEGHVYLEILNFSLSQSKSVCHIFHKFSKVKTNQQCEPDIITFHAITTFYW